MFSENGDRRASTPPACNRQTRSARPVESQAWLYYVPPVADLQVTISDRPDPVVAGDNVTYTIRLTNTGPATAQAVTVTSIVPTGTTVSSTVVTAPWTVSVLSRTVTFSNPNVAAGDLATFKVTVGTSASTPATVAGTVSIASSTTDPRTANNTGTTQTTVITSDVWVLNKVAMVSDQPVTSVVPGSSFYYGIWVGNRGGGPASGVALTDVLPAGIEFVGASAPGWSLTTPPVFTNGTVTAVRSEPLPMGRMDYLIITVRLSSACRRDSCQKRRVGRLLQR